VTVHLIPFPKDLRATVAVLGDAIRVVGYDDTGEAGYHPDQDCRERWHPAGGCAGRRHRIWPEWNNQFTNVHVGATDAEHALEASPI
jgi:hypothetical protein